MLEFFGFRNLKFDTVCMVFKQWVILLDACGNACAAGQLRAKAFFFFGGGFGAMWALMGSLKQFFMRQPRFGS